MNLADHVEFRRYVAIKIGQGVKAPIPSREAVILKELNTIAIDNPKFIQLYDSFFIKGPNGIHECLIMEPVAPLTSIDTPPLEHTIALMQQVAEGYSFLHDPYFRQKPLPPK